MTVRLNLRSYKVWQLVAANSQISIHANIEMCFLDAWKGWLSSVNVHMFHCMCDDVCCLYEELPKHETVHADFMALSQVKRAKRRSSAKCVMRWLQKKQLAQNSLQALSIISNMLRYERL